MNPTKLLILPEEVKPGMTIMTNYKKDPRVWLGTADEKDFALKIEDISPPSYNPKDYVPEYTFIQEDGNTFSVPPNQKVEVISK